MDKCKIIYYLCANLYLYLFYKGGSWITPEDSPFLWARFVFLLASFILLEKYDLVPNPLKCPRFYMLYKVVAAIIVVNIGLVSVWWQIEDFLKWSLSSIAKLLGMVLGEGKLKILEDPVMVSSTQLVVSLYFLWWVLTSTRYLTFPNIGNRGAACPASAGSSRGRRRSTSRNRC